jgi:hypothetical protein
VKWPGAEFANWIQGQDVYAPQPATNGRVTTVAPAVALTYRWNTNVVWYKPANLSKDIPAFITTDDRCYCIHPTILHSYCLQLYGLWSQWPRGLRLGVCGRFNCWDCEFESRREHGYLSVVSVVCCQVEAGASGWALVQVSPTECGVSEYDCEASIMRWPWPTMSCCAMKNENICHIASNATTIWLMMNAEGAEGSGREVTEDKHKNLRQASRYHVPD